MQPSLLGASDGFGFSTKSIILLFSPGFIIPCRVGTYTLVTPIVASAVFFSWKDNISWRNVFG